MDGFDTRVMIDPVRVSFSKDWNKDKLARPEAVTFTDAISRNKGYPVVTGAGRPGARAAATRRHALRCNRRLKYAGDTSRRSRRAMLKEAKGIQGKFVAIERWKARPAS
ncbi:MAG TPA: hypothetical protein VE046_01985 [Steroidobacteraceae bacterium]|nr:hypothetical protein [Steroidobacteraceae bacterium]